MPKSDCFLRFQRAGSERVYKVERVFVARVSRMLEACGWNQTSFEVEDCEPCFFTAEERAAADTTFTEATK